MDKVPRRLAAMGLTQNCDYELILEGSIGPDELGGIEGRTDIVWIEQIAAFPQKSGIGRKVMSTLAAVADEMGLTLMGNPWAQKQFDGMTDTLTQSQLERWYWRIGFKWRKENDHTIERPPAEISP